MGDHVFLKKKGFPGIVIDEAVGRHNGKIYYIVETDEEMETDDPSAYPTPCPLFDCLAEDLILLEEAH